MSERMKEFVVLNYHWDGCSFDFTSELHRIEASIANHKARIDLADKYDIESEHIEALPDLIHDSRYIKSILKGRFDILVIFEKDDYGGDIDCSDVDMNRRY